MEQVHPKTKLIWMFERAGGFIFLLGPIILVLMLREFEIAIKIVVITSFIMVLRVFWDIVFIPLDYKYHRYKYNDQMIEFSRGGLDRNQFYIPVNCIQHITLQQSVWSRPFNLYAIHIHTAGDTHKISYISKEKAEQMKDFITSLLSSNDGGNKGD